MRDAKKSVALVYGVTGGRHPQMVGLAATINRRLEAEGFNVVAHFGFSGGAIVAALMSLGIHKVENGAAQWVAAGAESGSHGKIGGLRTPMNAWNLLTKGGLINSATLHDKVFKDAFKGTLHTPAYAGSWCISHDCEVLFKLDEKGVAAGVMSSCALPFAISPMIRKNSELLEAGYGEVLPGIKDDPDGESYFGDGGICSALGVGIVDDVPEIREVEAETNRRVPVIGINIDNIDPTHKPAFGKEPWYKMLWAGCWGTVRANVLDDIREARSERYLQLCIAPTPPEMLKFKTKFDASQKDNLAMYQAGVAQAEEWLKTTYDGYDDPIKALNAALNGFKLYS